MNKLSIQDRVQILNALSEGVGISAAARMSDGFLALTRPDTEWHRGAFVPACASSL